MKTLLLAALFLGTSAYAAPVLNKNISSSGKIITIWPDHKDADQFYYAPTMMKLAKKNDHELWFNAMDFTDGSCRFLRRCEKRLMLTTMFEAVFNEKVVQEEKARILSSRPKARFSPVPFMSSQVEFGTAMTPFVDDHSCSPMGGQSSDLVPCTIVLNEKGIKRLVPRLQEGSLVAFNFNYKIYGVVDSAEGFKDIETTYSIAVSLGGEELKNHPDLDQ